MSQEHDDATPRQWLLLLPFQKPPLSLNNRMHHMAKARHTAAVRQTTMWAAAQHRLPQGLGKVRVEFYYVPDRIRVRDTDNLVATLKPIYDALAGGSRNRAGWGLVPDDSPEFMEKPEAVILPKGPAFGSVRSARGFVESRMKLVITELASPAGLP